MPKLSVNGKEVEFQAGMTVLQACEIAGEEIPRFCYHERLEIAGNCRMCLVQIEGGPPKPAASCAMPAAEGMKVHTNTPMVKKAREGVMEFLLINHPLDCPICDQAGECDLQDQSMAYGRGGNRFHENKRSVKDKYMGPLVKTQMTRCIHCTRCIRFLDDVAGVSDMGAVNRGENMEVGTFIEKAIGSEMSGNIIDLCPVGALTSKPYAFKARSWELKKTESIDVLDAVGCNIRIDARGNEVMRILPRVNEDINEEWISDKTRFAYDGLKNQRLDRPMVRKSGELVTVSWDEAYDTIAKKIKKTEPDKIAALVGDLADSESIMALKDLMEGLGCRNLDCRQAGENYDANNRTSYLFNTTIAGIEQADACLIIGANPRYEAPLVNTRLRKRSLKGGIDVAYISPEMDLTYKAENLGNNPQVLEDIISGKNPFAQKLAGAKNPMVIIGTAALNRKDSEVILGLVQQLLDKFNMVREGWNGFNVLHKAASRVGALDIGFVPGKGGKDTSDIIAGINHEIIDVVYLLGADEIDMTHISNAFVIYQGHHGDKGAHNADVILPGAAYTEKNATYVNMEGRVQQARMAVSPPGEAKEDWVIIKELAARLGSKLSYTDLAGVRARMIQLSPTFAKIDEIVPVKWQKIGAAGKLNPNSFDIPVKNFYMTDPISRASKTMAECTAEFVEKKKGAAA